MSIKRKFIVSNFLMLVIPFVTACAFATVGFFNIYLLLPEKSVLIIEQIKDEALLTRQLIVAFVAILLVIIITNIVITAFLSRRIVKPLEKLKEAADNIKDGNLDFEVIGSEDKEISQLCDAFDQMRMQLKASVARRLSEEKEQNMLLANISHDLRTPMTSIRGYLEGIADGVANTPEKMDRYITTILEKVNVLDELIEQLSSYSKMELGRIQYHFKRTDLIAFVKEVLEAARTDLAEADMELTYHLPKGGFTAAIDTEHMRRAFSNIINNAIKYKKPDRGSLSVTATYAQHGICIVFSDSGIGIREEELHRVFDGFYRGDPSRSPQVEGNGLGLSLVKKIIEAHRGKVWIKSAPQEGTSVYCYLPVKIETMGAAQGGEQQNFNN